MLFEIFVQALALLFLAFAVISFHAKQRKWILIAQITSILILSLHFFLLEAWSGAINQFILAIAVTLFLFKGNRILSNKLLLATFIIIFLISTLVTWHGFFSIFAFLGIASATIAKWQNDPKLIRFISIFPSIFWIIYDVFVGSYGGIIAESIILASIIVSLISKIKIGK